MRNPSLTRPLVAAVLMCCCALAFAQQGAAPADMAPFLNGGVGEEERAMLAEHAQEYSLKLTFAATTGAYLADVDIAITNAKHDEVLNLDSVGPVLLVKLPPGKYRIEATSGGKTQRKVVSVGKSLTQATLRW